MPIQLTTAFNPGDLEAGVTYAQVKIIRFVVDVDAEVVTLVTQYGNTDDNGDWVPAKAVPPTSVSVMDIPAQGIEGQPGYMAPASHFSDLNNRPVPVGSPTIRESISTSLYQALLDMEAYSGNIV